MRAHVTTDGSCVRDPRTDTMSCGGWAAIVENGSDGTVLRGRQGQASSTRMELMAVIEGLRWLPDGVPVAVHTDCTVILSVVDRWQRRALPGPQSRNADAQLWRDLAAQFDRFIDVAVFLVEKRQQDMTHRRCHLIAGAEAKALARGDGGGIPIPDVPSRPKRDWFIDPNPLAVAERRLARRRKRARQAAMRAVEVTTDDRGATFAVRRAS
jgi:ribonuclease HI